MNDKAEKRRSTVRANVAKLRERRRALGLVRVELWVRPQHVAAVKAAAKKIDGGPD